MDISMITSPLLKNIQDIKQVVVATNNGIPIRIGDIAEVKISHAPRLGVFQFDDKPDEVEGIIFLRRGENATEVLGRVREKINHINNHVLPPGIDAFNNAAAVVLGLVVAVELHLLPNRCCTIARTCSAVRLTAISGLRPAMKERRPAR
mgnify:CR=1 FL=1